MSAPLPVKQCTVKHCLMVHPAELVTDTGCISCSIGLQQVAAYKQHRALILASPAYAEQVIRAEHAYYHPVDQREERRQ